MYTYLALGDSYTIGEQVPATDNFPNQATRMLRSSGIEVTDPVIIATTGWTTDELAASIREHNIRDTFSFVTLLIGVNNQYRGRSIENYEDEFLQLLNTAIAFSGNHTNRVFVLSIPDWGVTPFAADRDRAKVASEIDAYNASCRRIALANGCHHLDITDSTRIHGNDAEYLVADELHPSGKEYAIWSERLTEQIKEELTK